MTTKEVVEELLQYPDLKVMINNWQEVNSIFQVKNGEETVIVLEHARGKGEKVGG